MVPVYSEVNAVLLWGRWRSGPGSRVQAGGERSHGSVKERAQANHDRTTVKEKALFKMQGTQHAQNGHGAEKQALSDHSYPGLMGPALLHEAGNHTQGYQQGQVENEIQIDHEQVARMIIVFMGTFLISSGLEGRIMKNTSYYNRPETEL